MKYLKLIIFFFIQVYCFGQSAAISVTFTDVAYLKLAPDNSSFNLVVTAPTVTGGSIIATNNSSKWINFTSAVPPSITHTVSAQINSGSVPSGMTLKLTINPVFNGTGALGANVSSINLSNTSQAIISNIGGAYTGQGVGNGYRLTFELIISDYSQLRAGSTNLSVTFTIT